MSEPTPEPFPVAFKRLLVEAAEQLKRDIPEAGPLAIDPTIITGEPDPVIAIKQLSGWMPVSCCLMTDYSGENHCEHPQPPRPPLRRRLRWRLSSWWSGLRMRVGSWVAGVDLDRWDEE